MNRGGIRRLEVGRQTMIVCGFSPPRKRFLCLPRGTSWKNLARRGKPYSKRCVVLATAGYPDVPWVAGLQISVAMIVCGFSPPR